MNTDIFTEEEAIKITVKHGYNGTEFNTAVWKSRGCLNPTRTMDGLISKLETIYHTVEVKGRGKKRKYTLKNKKEEMTEREYNYKGTVPTAEEVTMKEYIFNYLVNTSTVSKPYGAWVRDIDLFQRKSFSEKQLVEEITQLHMGNLFNPKEIVNEFINAVNNFNKSLVDKTFKRLEKEGRITSSISYHLRKIDGNYEEVDEERYEEINTFKKELVESKDIKYNQYIQAYFSAGHRSEKMQNIIKEVDEQMAEVFGVKYMYQAIGIQVLDENVKEEVSIDKFNQAYFQKFINLSINRQKRKDYQETKSFWRRTYLMNTLKILSIVLKEKLVVDRLEKQLSLELIRVTETGLFDYIGEAEDE
ncbi:hypothetical protein [Oceanobacillus kapialis]|uniref:hypothetical protein n=1 Tax=Oceanobacillus kapialis TaxID=481353 RepID=UPI00384E1001